MELRHLRYFLALADELHFGRAAQRLAISQPPLTVAIQQLEAEAGAPLFLRNSRGVQLTAAGLALVPRARALIDKAGEALREAREAASGRTGRLTIGFAGTMLYRGLPRMLLAFQAEHPRLALNLRELGSSEQLVDLLHGRLHAGFVHTTRVPAGLSQLLCPASPSWPACRRGTRWRAGERWRRRTWRGSRWPWCRARCRRTTTSASWRCSARPAPRPGRCTSCSTG